jgi:hypothetical protein
MRESERTVHETATHGTGRERSVCGQLISDPARYSRWYARHEHRMQLVGRLLRRESQLVELRRACVKELHRAALVRYLHEFQLSSEERDCTLRLFYGVTDPREAALLEHHRYLLAASSQLCATELLALAGDILGVDLIRRYERAYAQYFSLFCECARRSEAGQRCLLGELLPEVKVIATRLHEHIVGRDPRRIRSARLAPHDVASRASHATSARQEPAPAGAAQQRRERVPLAAQATV